MTRRLLLVLAIVGMFDAAAADAQVTDALTRARQAYNSKQFDAAIAAAREARQVPTSANSASVVLARAYLERYRAGSDAADLEAARGALADVRPALLSPSDRVEFLVGLGVSMFADGCLEGCYSAAAEFFDMALAAGGASDPATREPIFEWWANSLDRQAQYGQEEERLPIYRRILERAEAERARDTDSASATYWIASAARGVGDLNRSWGAAIAGWMRAKYLGPRGEQLRADLNEFVIDVLLPERAKLMVPDGDPRPVLETMRKQWEEVLEKYK